MSILDGVAEDTLAAFGDDFRDGVLLVPAAGTPDGQGGTIPGEPDEYPCKVLVTDPSDYRRIALGIPATDRLVLVLGASLSVVPLKGHNITAPDPLNGNTLTTFLIIARKADPAGALYKLQAR